MPMKPSLDQTLSDRGLVPGPGYEGYSQQVPAQVARLRALVHDRRAALGRQTMRIMEIGFNAGHSAEVFLTADPDALVTSFDLGHVPAVTVGKQFIDEHYPRRHTLIVGDSTVSVPAFAQAFPQARFDLLFIDGGHDYAVAAADISNCFALAGGAAIVAIDDTTFTPANEQHYTIGPTRAWCQAVRDGLLGELGREEYGVGRGMAWGHCLAGPRPSGDYAGG